MNDEEKNINSEETEGEDYGPDLIVLTDEDGVEHSFELVDTLEEGDNSYVALIAAPETPEAALEDDGNLVIMKIVEDEGEEMLELIEDDDEFEKISDIFMDRLSDLYEFEEQTGEDKD